MVDRLAELGALQYAAANTATASVNPSRIAASGYIHAMYAEYVTWSLANPGVNPSRLSAKGRIFGYFYDNATFSPLSLFAASEVGAWYDPSDLSTMFQDAAGTTPVTADGQPVGKILDKSGRGNHATQATAASRPLYKTDGTYHWLQFDGIDDYLETAAIDFTAVKQLSIFSGNSTAGVAGWKHFVLLGNGVANGAFAIQIPQNGTNGSAISYPTAAPSFKQDTWANAGINVKNVLSHMFNNNAATRQVVTRKNAAEVGFVSGTPYDSGFKNDVLRISGAGSESFNGNAYSLIVRCALSTADEITATETWVNSKTGAY